MGNLLDTVCGWRTVFYVMMTLLSKQGTLPLRDFVVNDMTMPPTRRFPQ